MSKMDFRRSLLVFGALIMGPSVKSMAAESATTEVVGESHFVVPMDLAKKVNKSVLGVPKEVYKDLGLFTLSAQQAEMLAHEVHEKQGHCGGFVDLAPYLADHKTRVSKIFREFVDAPKISQKVAYKAQYPKQSDSILANLAKKEFVDILNQIASFSDRSARTNEGASAAKSFRESFERWAKDFGRVGVETREVTTGSWYRQPSVIARIPGKNPQLPAVVLGGHMDTFPNNKPGADDDGSGTAAVMAVYKGILRSGLQFQRDLYFILYAAEEVGLVGSGQVVRNFQQLGIKVHTVMQLDMIGYRSPNDNKELYFVADNTDSGLTAFTKELAQKYLGYSLEQMEDLRCGYACSDHASWSRQGVASVFPFEASFKNYNQLIHTSSDTLSLVDMDHAFKFVRLAGVYVVELGDPI